MTIKIFKQDTLWYFIYRNHSYSLSSSYFLDALASFYNKETLYFKISFDYGRTKEEFRYKGFGLYYSDICDCWCLSNSMKDLRYLFVHDFKTEIIIIPARIQCLIPNNVIVINDIK